MSAAAELGILDLLAEPHTAEEVRARLALRSPQVVDLLDALAALGVLRGDGDAYVLAQPVPAELLDLAGGYRAWLDLPAALRDGGGSVFARLADEELPAFVAAMASAAEPGHAALVERLDLRGDEGILDVGGADGALGRRLVARHPDLRVTVLDRPSLGPLVHGVDFVGGDAFRDPWPEADVVVLSLVLLDWDTEGKRALLGRAHDAAERLVILDRFGVPRHASALAALQALHLLLTVGPAFPYERDDLEGWLDEAGFEATLEDVGSGFTLADARRVR